MSDLSIIVATFGDETEWNNIAKGAVSSVSKQKVPVHLIRHHSETLAKARNEAAAMAETQWLCFLDADDALDPWFAYHLLLAEGDIRRPATLGVYEDGTTDEISVMIPRRNLRDANYIVIGSLVRREQFLRVGGFRELPILEDWDLWIRCVQDGAVVVDVPEAIYRVGVHSDSRNKDVDVHNRVYREIRRTYF